MRRMLVPRQRSILLLATLIIVGVGFWAVQTHAASTTFSVESIGGQIGLGDIDLKKVVINIIKWALGVLSLVAVSYMIYGGYLWLTAAGNESRIEKAKQVILQAAIGMVIILLAWAIVLFVVRTVANTTSNRNTNENQTCQEIYDPNCYSSDSGNTFDITAVNTCAAPPDSWNKVPRSSAVSFTFNTDLMSTPTNVVQRAVGTGINDLQIEQCADSSCEEMMKLSGNVNPPPIDNQVYTPGSEPVGTAITPLAEWVASNNTLTFYHLSFSDTATANRYFKPNTTYRVTIPKGSAASNSKTLRDVRDRVLSFCRTSSDINSTIAHCDDSPLDKMYYTFTTSAETTGPAFTVTNTVPTSNYLTNKLLSVDRAVPRSTILGITFSGGVDPATVTTGHFRVYKITGAPTDLRTGLCPTAPDPQHQCDATQIDAAKFVIRVNSSGDGAWLQFKDQGQWFEPFTWYRVEVDNMRNLCGTAADARKWVFETNDVTPGVDFVYPKNAYENSCPSTEVFAQFKTSMWDITKGATCELNQDSSFKTVIRAEDANQLVTIGRNFKFNQRVNPKDDPNQFCKHLSYDPTSNELLPDHTYSIGLKSNLVKDAIGNKVEYGDSVAGFTPASDTPPWHFTVKPADKCFDGPYISNVIPGFGSKGACVSVIGNKFDPTNDGQGAKDTLFLGTQLQEKKDNISDSDIKSWTDSAIVNTVNGGTLPIGPSGTVYNYQVTVEYPAPIGKLQSPLSTSSQFRLDNGDAAKTACLFALTPNQGYPGETNFTATGQYFGAQTDQAEIHTDNHSPWDVNGQWDDSIISDILVKPAAQKGSTQVQVQTSNGLTSNPLPFKVISHDDDQNGGPDVPVVDETSTCDLRNSITPSPNPYKDDTQACINSIITVRFKTALDVTTVPSSALLYSCTEAACTTPILMSGAKATGSGSIVRIDPQQKLTPSTYYKVILTTGIKSSTHVAMAAPYTWKFSTKAGNDPCVVSDVTLDPHSPPTQTTNNPMYEPPYPLLASIVDNTCHTLDDTDVQYTWANTKETVGRLAPPMSTNHTHDSQLEHPDPPGAEPGTTDVTVTAQTHTSHPFSLEFSRTGCTTDDQCKQNQYGSCTGSVCKDKNCTPVVNKMDPKKGPIGKWTTILGCWFGDYVVDKSKVILTPASGLPQDAKIPDQEICGNGTWTNEQIIREIPDVPLGVTPVTVKRGQDGETAGSSFEVNTDALGPGICHIAPTSGLQNSPVVVDGRGFGDTRSANDNVIFTKGAPHNVTDFNPTPSWTENKINLHTPSDAELGGNLVNVVKGTETSNPIGYMVTNTNDLCPTSSQCTFNEDATCNHDNLNTFGCSYPVSGNIGCCVARPKVIGTTPPQNTTNVCSNAMPQIIFNQPLDPQTVTTNTVQYINNSSVDNGGVRLDNRPGSGTITYFPSAPLRNAQSMSVQPVIDETSLTVTNSDYATVNSSNQPTGWVYAGGNGTRVTDVPPSQTGYSLSLSTGATLITAAQTISGTNDGSTYRITGWINVQNNTKGSSGIRTVCDKSAPCGFNVDASSGPGTSGPTNGWKQIDYLVRDGDFVKSDPTTHHNLSLQCIKNGTGSVWCYGLQVTRVVATATQVRGASGVLVDPLHEIPTPLTYTAGTKICTMDGVSVDPTDMKFTYAGQTEPNFNGQAYKNMNGYPLMLSQVAGSYEWEWSSISSSDAIATAHMTIPPPARNSSSRTTVTAIGNGVADISTTARITLDDTTNTKDRTYTGTGKAHVDFCVHPWSFEDTNTNCDVGNTTARCRSFNFSLHYCADRTPTLLPDFVYTGSDTSEARGTLGSVEGVNETDANRLKSYFFKESAASHDTIGLLIFKNDEFLSPTAWYAKRFPLDSSGASTMVAGYPALKSGSTTYIGVTNRTSNNQLEGLMFVFDYNSNNASADTITIANQMLNTATFNTNLTTFEDKEKLIHDTQRMQDLASMKISLQKYKTKNGSYPALAGGTYIPGFTNSLWPSWTETLGTELGGTLPKDPVNAFSAACPGNAEASTCWAETTKTFICPSPTTMPTVTPLPPNSHLYGYRATSTGVDLYTTMEYPGGFTSAVTPSSICAPPNSCDCFGYTTHID